MLAEVDTGDTWERVTVMDCDVSEERRETREQIRYQARDAAPRQKGDSICLPLWNLI